MGGGDEAGRVKAEGGQVLRRGGCEVEAEMNP